MFKAVYMYLSVLYVGLFIDFIFFFLSAGMGVGGLFSKMWKINISQFYRFYCICDE